MASDIDPTKPTKENPRLSHVRANFLAAKTEIEALQDLCQGNYTIEIESSNGDEFRVGFHAETTLKARVFLMGKEVTDNLPATAFRWRRVSKYQTQGPPYDDDTWANLHGLYKKQIVIDVDDVNSQATFFCDIYID